VLADEGFLEAEPLGEKHRFAVLLERLAPVASDRVQRHRKIAELHAGDRRRLSPVATAADRGGMLSESAW
jgi:hypothetical protein